MNGEEVNPANALRSLHEDLIDINGEPWFVATDVCRALSVYVKANGDVNTTMALRKLADDGAATPANLIGGRRPKLANESGPYKLIMRSGRPEAEWFLCRMSERPTYILPMRCFPPYRGADCGRGAAMRNAFPGSDLDRRDTTLGQKQLQPPKVNPPFMIIGFKQRP